MVERTSFGALRAGLSRRDRLPSSEAHSTCGITSARTDSAGGDVFKDLSLKGVSMKQTGTDGVVDFAIVMTSGPDCPRRLISPFFLAAAAAAEERVIMYFTDLGALLLQKGQAEKVYPKEGGKSAADFMRLAQDNGVKLVLCKTSMDLHGLRAEDMIPEVPMLSVTGALPYLEVARKLLSF